MSAKVEKQKAGKSNSRVRQLEAELQNVRAELRETVERHEALTEDARAVREKLVEEELRESEERLKLSAEAGRIGNWQIDLTTDALESSAICKASFGLAANEDLSFERFFEILHADDRDRVRAALEKAVETATDYDAEYRVVWSDDSVHWIVARGRAFYAADGTPLRMLGVMQNITGRKDIEERLRKSEEHFRSYFELGLIGMAITSPTKGWLAVNDEFCKILGYERDEMLKKNWAEMTHPEDLAADVANFDRVMAGETDGYRLDKRFIRKDNQIIDATISVKCVRRDDGSVDYFVGLLEDTTKRKQAEKKLRESEENYRVIVNQSVAGISKLDLDGGIIFSNERFCEMLGYDCAELLEMKVEDVFYAGDAARNDKLFGRLKNKGRAFEIEKRLVRKDGSLIWVNNQVSPIFGGDGKPDSAIVVSVDITESKRVETLLDAQKQALEMVIVGSPLAEVLEHLARIVERQSANSSIASLMLLDDQGRLHNGAAPSLPEDFIQALEGIEADESIGTCSRAAATGETVITPDIAADPKWQDLKHFPLRFGWQSAWSMPIVASDGRVLGTFGTYFREKGEPTNLERQTVAILTRTAALAIERKQAENALREAHDELETRVERRTAELSRTNTLLREANENVEMILGSITDKFFALDSEWRITAFNKHAEEQLEALGKNPAGVIGKSLWDEFPNPAVEEAFRRAMNERAAIVYEHYHPLLEEWVENRIYPSKDGGLAVFQRYFTARKQAEEERARLLRQLVFAQEDERRRIAQDLHDEMGQYLSALALGLDSLKTFLSNGAQSPLDAIAPSSAKTQIERLEKIARQVDREVDRLTFELRPPSLDHLGLLAALRQYVENWSQITGIKIDFSSTGMENIRLSAEIETTIYRVVQEALTNAAKHARASRASVTLQHTHNRHIRLVIEDDGRGFDIDKVKDAPDAPRKLGLAGMRERLAQVGGAFEIESAEGKGTAVFVRVPLQSKDVNSYEQAGKTKGFSR
jgi:PAS domain S-box-containing protein